MYDSNHQHIGVIINITAAKRIGDADNRIDVDGTDEIDGQKEVDHETADSAEVGDIHMDDE